MIEIRIPSLECIDGAAFNLLMKTGNSRRVFVFDGEMGAGKTTFIKALCRELCVKDAVNSPTFSIINEYLIPERNETVYHFDFYRINTIEEAQSLGIEEYLYSGAYCFIEWPDIITPLLPDEFVRVNIIKNEDESRLITASFQ